MPVYHYRCKQRKIVYISYIIVVNEVYRLHHASRQQFTFITIAVLSYYAYRQSICGRPMCNGEKRTKLTDRWRPLANSGETTVLYDAAALRFEYWSAGAVSYRSNALKKKVNSV